MIDLDKAIAEARKRGLRKITMFNLDTTECMISAAFDRGGAEGWSIHHCAPGDVEKALRAALGAERLGVDPEQDLSWME
jgi:hypothetical protein